MGLTRWHHSKESTANAGDAGDVGSVSGSGSGRSSAGGNGNPPQLSLPGKSHGQRSLVGYIHGVAESDMTEHALTHALSRHYHQSVSHSAVANSYFIAISYSKALYLNMYTIVGGKVKQVTKIRV